MKKFKFKFETVLSVKEKREEQLKRELMQLSALRLEQEHILKRFENEKAAAYMDKGEQKGRGTDIMSLIYYESYLNLLRRQIDITNKKIVELQEKENTKRGEVIEASKEKKVFQRLKERGFNDFKKMVLSNEQKTLDEIAVNRYSRKEQHNY